jgi:hypothetical protein
MTKEFSHWKEFKEMYVYPLVHSFMFRFRIKVLCNRVRLLGRSIKNAVEVQNELNNSLDWLFEGEWRK